MPHYTIKRFDYLLAGIILIAVFFRFWNITAMPGGLFPDEAANGLDVNSILSGDVQPFYERGNGREALFFYALAASVASFGRGPWQHHAVSGVFGVLAVIATFYLTRRLFNEKVAYLAAFFMAVSSYAVTLSRTSFRAGTVPLLAALTLLFLVKFFQEKDKKAKLCSAILAGIFFGLGFYTYISFRMMIPLLLFLAGRLAFSYRRSLKKFFLQAKKPIIAFGASFVAAFGWLGFYFITHPGTFIGRAGQVSIFSPDLNRGDLIGTFLEVLKKTILSFFTAGDLNWRHNVSGYPFLSPFLSPFFAVALVIFIYAVFRPVKTHWQKTLVALWFSVMLLPEITTAEGIPHGLRLAGVIPAIFILPAWLVAETYQRLNLHAQWKKIYAAVFIGSLFVYNFYLYFGIAASSPDQYYAYRSDLTAVSGYLNQRNAPRKTYLSLDKFSVQTVDYLTSEKKHPYALLDPARTWEVKLKSGDQVVFTQSTLFDRIKFSKTHAQAKLVLTEKNRFGQIIMLVYEQQ